MNCANHPDRATVAYCRTCGKGLCQECAHTVRGVIYCENCLAARLEGVQPPQGQPQGTTASFVPPAQTVPPPAGPSSGPNPTVAGILGAIPFGVGAIYCGQYAKGLAHMLIFIGLVWGASEDPSGMGWLFGLGIPFLIVYQIFDAVRTARAIQAGQPAPDPFGLGQTFSAGKSVDTTKVPAGAIVLIGLGFLFMLETMGFHFFRFGRLWPLILIGIGAWLFAVRWGYLGQGDRVYDCDRCRSRGTMGPAVLVTLGTLFLFQELDVIPFHRTWPLLLVVIGLVKVLQGNASTAGHADTQLPPTSAMPGPTGVAMGDVQPPASEVKNG